MPKDQVREKMTGREGRRRYCAYSMKMKKCLRPGKETPEEPQSCQPFGFSPLTSMLAF